MTITDDFGEIDWAYALTVRIPGAASVAVRPGAKLPTIPERSRTASCG